MRSIARVALLAFLTCFVQCHDRHSCPCAKLAAAAGAPDRAGRHRHRDRLRSRLYAERLGEIWNKPVVIENRPGGDGITGVAAFAGTNDDHTLLFAHSARWACSR